MYFYNTLENIYGDDYFTKKDNYLFTAIEHDTIEIFIFIYNNEKTIN